MPLRNGKQYIESLRDGREVYIHGERVDDITKHPSLRKAINHGAIDYELDKRPELRDLLVTQSLATGNEIRRYFELPRTAEDLLKRQKLIETTTRNGGSVFIFMKEIGTDALNALNMVCYDMDKKYATDYSDRVARYREYLEENDLSMSGAVADVKGDRKLKPSQQEMPDYHLRVVDRLPEGVVVRESPGPQTDVVAQLVSYISECMTLLPGTVILTGPPEGVGFVRKPPVFLKEGQRVESEIEGIGILSNPVARQR